MPNIIFTSTDFRVDYITNCYKIRCAVWRYCCCYCCWKESLHVSQFTMVPTTLLLALLLSAAVYTEAAGKCCFFRGKEVHRCCQCGLNVVWSVCVCVCACVRAWVSACVCVIFIRCDKRTSNNRHKKQSQNDVQYKAAKPKTISLDKAM